VFLLDFDLDVSTGGGPGTKEELELDPVLLLRRTGRAGPRGEHPERVVAFSLDALLCAAKRIE